MHPIDGTRYERADAYSDVLKSSDRLSNAVEKPQKEKFSSKKRKFERKFKLRQQQRKNKETESKQWKVVSLLGSTIYLYWFSITWARGCFLLVEIKYIVHKDINKIVYLQEDMYFVYRMTVHMFALTKTLTKYRCFGEQATVVH